MSAPAERRIEIGAVRPDAQGGDGLGEQDGTMRIGRHNEPGTRLLILTRFSRTWDEEVRAPIVALRGRVSRVEPQPGREDGVAVTITRCRFL